MIYEYLITFILTFLMVYSLTPMIIKFAMKINFVDNPSQRKVHKKVIPLMGGVAVFIGFFSFSIYNVLLLQHKDFDSGFISYISGAFLIMIIGLIDDKIGMKPKVKLIGQLLVCLIFIYFNKLYNLFGHIYITLPILILWMVGLMNAFNFLDNMDGILSGMSGILALGFFALGFLNKAVPTSVGAQSQFIAIFSITFAGATFGFLPHNFNPAKIFLGDAGSMFIGYFLSTMGILTGRQIVNHANSNLYYLLPILLLSYAIFDITLVSYTRKRDGRHISEGGKDHSTHRIGNYVGSTKLTAIIVYIINLLIALLSVFVFEVNSKILLLVSTIIFSTIFIFFGSKLDEVPIIITKNQIKKKKER